MEKSHFFCGNCYHHNILSSRHRMGCAITEKVKNDNQPCDCGQYLHDRMSTQREIFESYFGTI